MGCTWLSLHELRACAEQGVAPLAFSPLGTSPVLAVDLRGDEAGERGTAGLRQWLGALAGVSIALTDADAATAMLAREFDAVVTDAATAEQLAAAVRQAPLAATVLVQLLRASEGLPLQAALLAESLAYSTLQAGPEYRAWLQAHRAPAPAAHGDCGPAVTLERSEDRLQLALNRPSLRNAMTVEMRDALVEALELVLADDSIRAVELRGVGKCFSTGGDLTEFGSAPDPATAHLVRSLALPGRLLARCAGRVTVQVHGACVGSGIEFPAFAGRIVATADAWFQLPELKFGLIPGAGGTVSIARRIGRQRLAEWVLSGRRIDARTALAWGLVDAIGA